MTYRNMNIRTLTRMAQILISQGFTAVVTYDESVIEAGCLTNNANYHQITAARRAVR